MFNAPSFWAFRTYPVSVPVATAATSVTHTSFVANWNVFSGAVYYLLDVSTNINFTTFILENQAVATNSYLVTGLTPSTTYYYRVRAVTSYDSDYQNIINYANTQGYTLPSVQQRALQDVLLTELKSIGAWNLLDTMAVFASDGDDDFTMIDWKRLSQYTLVNSPARTIDVGYTGDNVSAYIDSNWNLLTQSTNYTITNCSLIVYAPIVYRDNSQIRAVVGALTPTGNNQLTTIAADIIATNQLKMTMNAPNSGLFGATFQANTPWKHVARNSNPTIQTWQDLITQNGSTNVNAIPNDTLTIFRWNASIPQYSASQVSLVMSGGYLGSINTQLRNAWLNYYNNL